MKRQLLIFSLLVFLSAGLGAAAHLSWLSGDEQ
jgi:hypothetical protein